MPKAAASNKKTKTLTKTLKLQTRIMKKEMKAACVLVASFHEAVKALDQLETEDELLLQRLMEQKSQLEQMISNVMKAASEATSTIVGSLKAS